MFQNFGECNRRELFSRRVKYVHLLERNISAQVHGRERLSGMLEACIADVPSLNGLAARRGSGEIEKQSVTGSDLEMAESVRIVPDEIVAEELQHLRVVTPPQLRREQSVHVARHQIRVRINLLVRLRKSR